MKIAQVYRDKKTNSKMKEEAERLRLHRDGPIYGQTNKQTDTVSADKLHKTTDNAQIYSKQILVNPQICVQNRCMKQMTLTQTVSRNKNTQTLNPYIIVTYTCMRA